MNHATQFFVIFWTLLSIIACKSIGHDSSGIKVDASKSVFLDAEISDGLINVPSSDSIEIVEKKINAQLTYTSGDLETVHGSSDLGRNVIKILSRENYGDPLSKIDVVRYATTLVIAWPKERPYQKTIRFALPVNVDQTDNDEIYRYHSEPFYAEFSKKCLDKASLGKPSYKFWHYIVPHQKGCPLDAVTKQDQLATDYVTVPGSDFELVGLTAVLKPSGSSTTNKKPEYEQIWKDGKLVFVAVFTSNQSFESDDLGIQALSHVLNGLTTKYGKVQANDAVARPVKSNFDITKKWPTIFADRKSDGYLNMTLESARGPMEFHFFIRNDVPVYDGVRDEEQSDEWNEFKKQINAVGGNVDVLAYFGHSGLGKNIRAFLKLPNYNPGQYSIFWFSACTSFMYLDQGLREMNMKLNPNSSPYKYFDVIANGYASFFGTETADLLALTDALVEKNATYRQILDRIHPKQRPLVFGEEDNGQPF